MQYLEIINFGDVGPYLIFSSALPWKCCFDLFFVLNICLDFRSFLNSMQVYLKNGHIHQHQFSCLFFVQEYMQAALTLSWDYLIQKRYYN